MELGFNLLFLAIASACLCCWVRQRSQGTRHLGICYGALVLACALMLLFPLISITDDLHPSSEVFEETGFSARKAHVVRVMQVIAAPVPVFGGQSLITCHFAPSSLALPDVPQVTLAVFCGRAPPRG